MIRISISRNTRSIEVIQGYQNKIVASQQLTNTQNAFSEFLSALDRAGYTRERRTNYSSEAGMCPTGNRFVFSSNQFSEDFRRWSTSCREQGNFGGQFSTVQQLYQTQIPDYSDFISNARRDTGLAL